MSRSSLKGGRGRQEGKGHWGVGGEGKISLVFHSRDPDVTQTTNGTFEKKLEKNKCLIWLLQLSKSRGRLTVA